MSDYKVLRNDIAIALMDSKIPFEYQPLLNFFEIDQKDIRLTVEEFYGELAVGVTYRLFDGNCKTDYYDLEDLDRVIEDIKEGVL